jgi:hypothetical protein
MVRMRLLAALAVVVWSVRASAQPATGSTVPAAVPALSTGPADTLAQNSGRLLDAQDKKTALNQAEAAVQAGGGPEAYAARADAELALSKPDDALIDYAEAARRDPGRYGAKYAALKDRLQPKTDKRAKRAALGGVAGVSIGAILGLAGGGAFLIVFGLLYLRRKKTAGKSAAEL